MKVKVCMGCGHIQMAVDQTGKPACPICMGNRFDEADLPPKLKCTYCKKERTIEEILKIWTKPPFFNVNDGTYYDGCRGWN